VVRSGVIDFKKALRHYAEESATRALSDLDYRGSDDWAGALSGAGLEISWHEAEDREERGIAFLLSGDLFSRLCQDLVVLGPERSTELLNKWIRHHLEVYRQECAPSGSEVPGAAPVGALLLLEPPPLAPVILYGTSWGGDSRGDPTGEREFKLFKLRSRLLILVLAAADLNLTGTHRVIVEVARQAVKERGRPLPESRSLGPDSLYNRRVLGYALLATSGEPERCRELLAGLGKEVVVRRYRLSDSQRSPYDVLPAPGPIDYTKGVLTVRYLPALTDEEFDLILTSVQRWSR